VNLAISVYFTLLYYTNKSRNDGNDKKYNTVEESYTATAAIRIHAAPCILISDVRFSNILFVYGSNALYRLQFYVCVLYVCVSVCVFVPSGCIYCETNYILGPMDETISRHRMTECNSDENTGRIGNKPVFGIGRVWK